MVRRESSSKESPPLTTATAFPVIWRWLHVSKTPLVVACELHCVPLDKSREEKGSTTLGLSPKQQVFGCTKDGGV